MIMMMLNMMMMVMMDIVSITINVCICFDGCYYDENEHSTIRACVIDGMLQFVIKTCFPPEGGGRASAPEGVSAPKAANVAANTTALEARSH